MRGRRRLLLLGPASLVAAPRGSRAMVPPYYDLTADDLRRAFAGGATLVGRLEDRLFVERYEPTGRLRGTCAGRAYEGSWRLDGPRLCTQVASDAPVCLAARVTMTHTVEDGSVLSLFGNAGVPTAFHATYRTRPPWATRSPHLSARVRMIGSGLDNFQARGAVQDLPADFPVWTGRPMRLDRQADVVIHGTTDGVTFTAEQVTWPDGRPLP